MRVTAVEPIAVAYPEPNDAGAIRHLLLVRLRTDDGAVGWGEAVTMWPEASRGTAAVVEGLAELVLGRDPLDAPQVWRRLKEHCWWYGEGGLASLAIAAIDIALWDLAGQAAGRPVLDLIGGPAVDRLPAMVSCHAFKADISQLAADIAGYVGAAMFGVKVGFGKRGEANLGFEHHRDVAFVRALREALGERPAIAVDLGVRIRWSVAEAVARTRAFEDHGLEWIEEPLGARDPSGYRTLRNKTTTKIAYGEREWTADGVQQLLDTDTVDVVGLDPGRVEGISGFLEAAHRVHVARRQANAHAWSSAIVQAASLAVSWASPACRVLEVKPLPSPVLHDLVHDPVLPVDGQWERPTHPGLGIQVDPAVVEKYRMPL